MTRGVASTAGRPGVFITLEGPEGSGKTTQAARIAQLAADAGLDIVLTREPGGTPTGERIRTVLLGAGRDATRLDPRTDALLFNAARAQLVAEVIGPALARGEIVICARFADSTAAYQGAGQGLAIAELREIEALATGGLKPDRTILLDLPVQAGLARKPATERTRFETGFDLAFHERVRAGFLAIAEREPKRFVVVDAGRSPDEVTAAILDGLRGVPGLTALGKSPDETNRQDAGDRPVDGSDSGPDAQRLGDLERAVERMYA